MCARRLLFYLITQQIKTLTSNPYSRPILGLFMADGHVSFYYIVCVCGQVGGWVWVHLSV